MDKKLYVISFFYMAMASLLLAQSSRELLAKMKDSLGFGQDLYAVLKIEPGQTANSSSFAVFHFFQRQDAEYFVLLGQNPIFLNGISFFKKRTNFYTYNPQTALWQETEVDILSKRLGLYLEELVPSRLLSLNLAILDITNLKDKSNSEITVISLESPYAFASSIKLYLRKPEALPVYLEYLSAEGKVLRKISFASYYKIEGKYYLNSIRLFDFSLGLFQINFNEVTPQPLPDFVFTKAYIEEITR